MIENKGLLFDAPTGIGKSTTSIKIVKEYLHKDDFKRLLNYIRDWFYSL
ncbi:hypothetical protein [Acholeplasma oculi]|uniref:P-loop containing nucleoside triphosphate hydrolase n=1 Tax=Acholeplasma oculi TaxID=35623 RepID=A0A061AHR0_9MOLU|nr:hypothetical protein [Acholeplasma oculi]CDR30512.1 hypothetical protein Aocu_04390 [Acholeplasma oculi]